MHRPYPYSLTSRIDLLTVMVLTAICSTFFAVLRLINANSFAYLFILSTLLLVAFAQMIFQRYNHPRLVSMLAGVVVTFAVAIVISLVQGRGSAVNLGLIVYGAVYGYVFGVFASSSMLIADNIRSIFCKPKEEEEAPISVETQTFVTHSIDTTQTSTSIR